MARFPGAIWRPLNSIYLPNRRIVSFNRMNLHVAVSESSSLFGYFNSLGKASSHFYVRKDGTTEQYVDTDWQAEADLDGNDATISVETQGGLNNAQGEPWTDAQVNTLARLFAWAVATHGIPARLATDSRIGASSHGLSWHRLGIDGNFPALPSTLAGRLQRGGGMHYSNSYGKICPGNTKITQIPSILARAISTTISDSTASPNGSIVVPTMDLPTALTPFLEDDMIERTLIAAYRTRLGRMPTASELDDRIMWVQDGTRSLDDQIKDIAADPAAKAFAALAPEVRAARRAKAAVVDPIIVNVETTTPNVAVEIDYDALAAAFIAHVK